MNNEKRNNSTFFGRVAGVLGFLAVVMGAFGAHALQPVLAQRGMVEVWKTAVEYHLAHAVGLLAVTAWLAAAGTEGAQGRWLRWAGRCWIAGVVLFSGSLYLLALGGPHWLGPVTPVGGLALMAGWVGVGMAAWRGGRGNR
jgi:uncharacterized membrane protein YgdD (TMEM256/DUF423 family)